MSTIKKITTNYSFRIPIFDAPGWGREMERNFDIIDSVMFLLSNFGSVRGLWLNGTAYNSGDRVVDPSDGKLFQALESHTSADTGTFAQDRAAHPTYWKLTSNTVQNRGEWETSTTYNVNDFIAYDHKYGVAVAGYTSGVSYDADVLAGNIVTLIDLTDDYNDVTNAASYVSTMETAINALYNIRTDITTVAAIDTDVASVAAIAPDVTTVASDTSNISTVANNIADVQEVASISSAVTNVSGISSDVTNVSGISADVEAVAAAIPDIQAAAADLPSLAAKANLDGTNIEAQEFRANLGLSYADLKWLSVPVGGIVFCDPTNGDAPPTDSGLYRFVELTAGLDGSGEYNEGILTDESITGSGATLVATAVVDLDGSSYDGKTINLINTEGRVIYAGETAGTVFNDQAQQITGQINGLWRSDLATLPTGAFSETAGDSNRSAAGSSGPTQTLSFNNANSSGARVGDRTRAKGITQVAYMRIK